MRIFTFIKHIFETLALQRELEQANAKIKELEARNQELEASVQTQAKEHEAQVQTLHETIGRLERKRASKPITQAYSRYDPHKW